MQHSKTLNILAKAWGEGNDGYCFFSYIDREAQATKRKDFFHEVSFFWPTQKNEIIQHMTDHEDDDLYWCPVLFTENLRRSDLAYEEYCLWADLDEADPRTITDYAPTVAWETSPGRYQALWLLEDTQEDGFFGAAHAGGENQRLTHYLSADPSGWDITQLLRIPGWDNHKQTYTAEGYPAQGKLLWYNGPKYSSSDFSDLPEVANNLSSQRDDSELEAELEEYDRRELMKRVKSRIPLPRYQALVTTDVDKDRSTTLRGFTYLLAESGFEIAEIICILRATEWNKFAGRPDELHRLNMEASSAFDSVQERLEEQGEQYPTPIKFFDHPDATRRPDWLIPGILTKGGVGFIGGEPKMKKSWVATDLALTLAMVRDGYHTSFMNTWRVNGGGPVLYLVLEDPIYVTYRRAKNIISDKLTWRMYLEGGEVYTDWPEHDDFSPLIDVVGSTGVSLSSTEGVEWLKGCVNRGYSETGEQYCLVIIDTLMTAAGDIDENRSFEVMAKLLSPIKKIRESGCSILFVHHFRKSQGDTTRSGQRLLGAQAFHAWSEDSMYISATPNGDMKLDLESKSAISTDITLTLFDQNTWSPRVATDRPTPTRPGRPSTTDTKVLKALAALGAGDHTISDIIHGTTMTPTNAKKQLRAHLDRGQVTHPTPHTWATVS